VTVPDVEPVPGATAVISWAPLPVLAIRAQYAYGMVIGFNYERPVPGRGAGIFLHVNGRGATAGCVSVPEASMRRILQWADPSRKPHLAIGTASGATAITKY
jgi:hypothetical protein